MSGQQSTFRIQPPLDIRAMRIDSLVFYLWEEYSATVEEAEFRQQHVQRRIQSLKNGMTPAEIAKAEAIHDEKVEALCDQVTAKHEQEVAERWRHRGVA